MALIDNIVLALNGCMSCWASWVIVSAESLGVDVPSSAEDLFSKCFESNIVAPAPDQSCFLRPPWAQTLV